MKRRYVLASMGAFTVSGSLMIGSGGFSSTKAERSVSVDVVSDPSGFLGLRYPDENGGDEPQQVTIPYGDEEDLFWIQNGFSADIGHISVEGDNRLKINAPEIIEQGGDAQITAESNCNQGSIDNPVELKIAASGDGFSITANRVFQVETECPTARLNINRSGNSGNFSFDASGSTPSNSINEYRWDFNNNGEVDRSTENPETDIKCGSRNSPSYCGANQARVEIVTNSGDTDEAVTDYP